MILGTPKADWLAEFPRLADLIALRPSEWFNPAIAPSAEALADVGLGAADVADASARLQRFAPLIARLFPETAASGGIIESDLVEVATFHDALRQHYAAELPGRLWLKRDSHLPISGSIKARGGIYEVLAHAERLALEHGLVGLDDDYSRLAEADCRAFFARHRIAVGSTGNLGLSIGIIGAALGFQASVHMSADARQWKKDKLRAHGVTVVEYASDYSVAVEQGRREAAAIPTPISSTTKTPATCSSATPSPPSDCAASWTPPASASTASTRCSSICPAGSAAVPAGWPSASS